MDFFDLLSSMGREVYESATSGKGGQHSMRALMEENKLEFPSQSAFEIGDVTKLIAFHVYSVYEKCERKISKQIFSEFLF